MRTLIWLSAFGIAVGMSACGDDDGGMTTMDAGGGGTDSGGGGTDSGGGGTDSGGGGTDSGMAMDDAGGGGDDAGMTMDDAGTTGGSAEAMAFCATYETTCTFEGMRRYESADECITEFDGASMDCQTCITTHVALAGDDPGTHCPHATTTAPPMAMGPCAGDCM